MEGIFAAKQNVDSEIVTFTLERESTKVIAHSPTKVLLRKRVLSLYPVPKICILKANLTNVVNSSNR